MTGEFRINGPALRGFRRARGLTQSELGAMVGLTKGSISNMEHGRQNASLEVIGRLMDALGVGFDAIVIRPSGPGLELESDPLPSGRYLPRLAAA